MRPRCLRATLSFAFPLLFALLSAHRAEAQATQVKPWFLIVFDTSGSMSDAVPPNTCGYPATKIGAARCAVRNIMDSFGDAQFGLLQFTQDHDATPSCTGGSCAQDQSAAWLRVQLNSASAVTDLRALVDGSGAGPIDELCAAGYTPIGGALDGARDYFAGTLDYTGGAGADASPTATDTAAACRPMSIILLTDGAECCDTCQTGGCPGPEAEFGGSFGTCATTCTDVPSCNGGNQHSETGPQRAHELYHSTMIPTPGGTIAKAIKTYAIGFGIAAGDARIERIARAGHTDAPGANYGFYADNEAALSAALNQIILESIKTEICNGVDDDCDARIDEGSPKYCDIDGLRTSNPLVDVDLDGAADDVQANLSAFPCSAGTCTAIPGTAGNTLCAQPEWANSCSVACQTATTAGAATGMCVASPASNTRGNLLCTSPGEQCDQSDDDCDGRVDEAAPPCFLDPPANTMECPDLCDLTDSDCDGLVDEDCTPTSCQSEICDGSDNNPCDTCGADETPCSMGQAGCVNGCRPLQRTCGTDVGACVSGIQTCIGGQWGADDPATMTVDWTLNFCPSTNATAETCNNIDDDCDGVIDRITQACMPYPNVLECLPGLETCVGGVWQYSHGAGTADDVPANCVGAKGPTAEICDTLNNDCNVSTPDGSADSRINKTCGNAKGICDPGLTVCTAGNIVCNDPDESQNEICDGLDNDCDGSIDENTLADPLPPPPGYTDFECFPGMLPPIAPIGECQAGQWVCAGGAFECRDFIGPTDEICDTLNNDCDIGTPDGADDPRVGQDCGTSTGECDPGSNVCTSGMIMCSGGQGPVFEECDGLDNDCDFITDEDLPDDDNNGMLDPDTTCDPSGFGNEGVCDLGQERCVQTGPNTFAIQCTGGAGPSTEICDGEDNDCDGDIDECAGDHASPGYMACVLGTLRGNDLGPLGAGGGDTCGTSVGPCETGLTKCVPDTMDLGNTLYDNPGYICVGEVPGMPEVCNGADDDCDVKVDEMLTDPWLGDECMEDVNGDPVVIPACREPNDATEPCGRCQLGQYGCVDGAQVCNGAVGQATYESCNGSDDDCDGDVDECVDPNDSTCTPGEIDPNTPVGSECAAGECQSGTNVCMDGKLVCEGEVISQTEICNNLDDDCDGSVDEGFNKGAPCTESGEPAVGECKPGMIVCDPDTGGTECVGEKKPSEEICDSLDNDCDREVDEGINVGAECGKDEGECEPGMLVCVSGRTVCEGEVGPAPEVCDCKDNDCDGKIDEGTGDNPVCPAVGGVASQCLMCQCALPCVEADEFDRKCPQGKAPVEDDEGMCFCVGELCKQFECQNETLKDKDTDVVQCAPDDPSVGECTCKNNECTFRCKGVTCDEGLACDPTDGSCKQATCLLAQFACPSDERCGMEGGAWKCLKDDCADASCEADQACRDGDCIGSCAKVTCSNAGEKCVDGECVTDECSGVSCDSTEVCNPKDGKCVPAGACRGSGCRDGEVCDPVSGDCGEDPCLRTHCPTGQICDSSNGQCKARCGGTLVFCGDACVNPMSDREHCGATDDCAGANAGEACADGLVCNLGECSDMCASGLVNCDGSCIDPMTSQAHCGAKDQCDGADSGKLCSTGYACMAGVCRLIAPPAGGTGGSGGGGHAGSGALPDGTRVIASGGGGCACSVPGATQHASPSTRGPLALVLSALLLLALARRRARQAAWLVRRAAPLAAALFATTLASGCKVDTFCLDCPIPGQTPDDREDSGLNPDNPDAGGGTSGFGGGGSGTGGGGSGTGGSSGIGGNGADSGVDAGPACMEGAPELCNSRDDDCDGEVDEDADLTGTGIDIQTDVANCGGCGNVCALPHAYNECVDGGCQIDRSKGDNGCDVGFIDLNGKAEDGCEYQCTKIADDDSACNLLDDDCDGDADEDVDTDTDVLNCGGCNFSCPHNNADDGAVCSGGDCSLDPTKCNDMFADVDGESANGCEYPCKRWPKIDELCNLQDDDCDGKVDESVASTDPDVGDECGSTPTGDPDQGDCTAGHKVCDTGVLVCQGFVGPSAEVCDGVDNDCDGNTDGNDIPELGLPCYPPDPVNGPRVGSECHSGTLTIPSGGCSGGVAEDLVCTGYQGPSVETCDGEDDDCDGKIDEAVAGVKPGAGLDCINGAGGSIIYQKPAQWVDGVTLCAMGKTECSGGTVVCLDEVAPEPIEQCDDKDHDCDGNPLNGYTFSSGIATTGPDPDLGDPCGNTDVGECTLGSYVCSQSMQALVCQFPNGVQTSPVAESCDGKDNDCDGDVDETDGTPPTGVGQPCRFDSGGTMLYGPSVTALAPCIVGHTVCAAGKLACPDYVGPTAELCDNVDQDCDGVLKEGTYPSDVRIGASCDTDANTTGLCNAGTQICSEAGSAPTIACTGEIFPSAETCDGDDNDCDAQDDDGQAETWINDACTTNSDGTINLSPAAPIGTCGLGQAHCLGGVQQCIGEVGPGLETCDTTVKGPGGNPTYSAANDQDCDNKVDEDFALADNVQRCGTCSNDCRDDVAHANMTCVAGDCTVASCQAGYYDNKTTPAADCSIVDCDVANLPGCCNFGGVEICDGQDNDCDGVADESIAGQPIQLPDPTLFCLQLGACASSGVQCRTHAVGDLDNLTCGGMGQPMCVTEPVCTTRPTTETCNAPYNMETSATYDEDCDGSSDSVEFNLSGACTATGTGAIGACATVGNFACDLTTMSSTDTFCSNGSGMPVQPGTPGSEATSNGCNNTDDDCDGDVDEACGVAGTTGSCVTDNWVAVPGSSSFIYAYEASRRDATSAASGTSTARACSMANRQPWGNLTWDEAEAACAATHPQGRLCTEEEWQAACEIVEGMPANVCAWSFSASCNTFTGNETTCNGLDFAGTGDDIQASGVTGASGGNACSRPRASSTSIFDMSGNVKEFTDYGLDGTLPVRGGANNNTGDGMRCNFDYTVWPDPGTAKFSNVGFRCCRGAPCTVYTQTTPQTSTGGSNVSSVISVAGSGITSITSVTAWVKGTHTDLDDVRLRLTHGATTLNLVDLSNNCNNGLDQPYQVTFTDLAATTPSVSGACTFLNSGVNTKPAQAFSGFSSAAADGTWTLLAEQFADDDNNETSTITQWSIRVCGN